MNILKKLLSLIALLFVGLLYPEPNKNLKTIGIFGGGLVLGIIIMNSFSK